MNMVRRGRGRRGLQVLISAGPTREPIDPVRFLSNYSTGYMGSLLAQEALTRGHRTTIVSGPTIEGFPATARVIRVETARQMAQALRRHIRHADAVIMAAAVADYRPARVSLSKLPRRGLRVITLQATPDILSRLPRKNRQVFVGCAVETDRVVWRARQKLRAKRLDLLLAQRVGREGTPFGRRAVQAWLVERGGPSCSLGRRSKRQLARVLLDKIEALCYGQRGRRHA